MRPTRVVTWNEVNPAFKGYTSCPNGQFDARTGEYINFTMDVGYQSTKYNFFTISDRNPKGALIGSITAPAAYVNSFSITPKYIILVSLWVDGHFIRGGEGNLRVMVGHFPYVGNIWWHEILVEREHP